MKHYWAFFEAVAVVIIMGSLAVANEQPDSVHVRGTFSPLSPETRLELASARNFIAGTVVELGLAFGGTSDTSETQMLRCTAPEEPGFYALDIRSYDAATGKPWAEQSIMLHALILPADSTPYLSPINPNPVCSTAIVFIYIPHLAHVRFVVFDEVTREEQVVVNEYVPGGIFPVRLTPAVEVVAGERICFLYVDHILAQTRRFTIVR